MPKGTALAAWLTVALAGGASAATTTVMVGDDDCFGFPGLTSCPDGSTIPSVAPANRSGPGDPAGTDAFGALGTVSFSFDIDLTGLTPVAASVSARTVGLDGRDDLPFGDAFNGARFRFNGADVGTFFEPPVQPTISNIVRLLSFDVLAELQDGINTLTIVPEEAFEQFGVFEDYAVDFARLEVETAPTTVIPLPAAAPLLAAAIATLAWSGRRRRLR